MTATQEAVPDGAVDAWNDAEPASAGTTNRTWLLILLTAVYASNFVDRTIVTVLQQPIKTELQLQDWQLGLLGGTSFALFYTVLGLVIARQAERGDRVRLLSLSILAWSAFTALCGAAGSFTQLLLLRVGVAIGESGATPAAHSLISDYFSPAKRAGALAIFAFGNTIGFLLGAVLGGLVGQACGWRWAFVAAGAPGIILALLTRYTIDEPRRRASVERVNVPPVGAVLRLLASRRSFGHMAFATALATFCGYGSSQFIAPYLMRSFDASLALAGTMAGIGSGIMIGLGTLVGGMLVQRFAAADRRCAMWVPGAGMLLAAPMCLVAFTASDIRTTMIGFSLMSIGIGTFQGPVYSTVHALVEPRMRATATAAILLVTTLIGLGLGPLLIGGLSDLFASHAFGAPYYAQICARGTSTAANCIAASATGLGRALLICSAILAWSAFHYFQAARSIRTDVID